MGESGTSLGGSGTSLGGSGTRDEKEIIVADKTTLFGAKENNIKDQDVLLKIFNQVVSKVVSVHYYISDTSSFQLRS